jgi:hypothetical protein
MPAVLGTRAHQSGAEVAEGRPLASVEALAIWTRTVGVVRNPDREIQSGTDRPPFVTPVRERNL